MAHTQTGVSRTLLSKRGTKKYWLIQNYGMLSSRNKEDNMAQERLTVRKIREILRLKHEASLSNRAIAGACNISNSTVGEYLRRAEAAGISWPLGELGEDELYQKLFGDPVPVPETKPKPLPDWE